MKTNMFLVRHGETEWNKQNRLQGNQDSPLTSNGIQQALAVKRSLGQHRIDLAFVSPLKRARDTLEIILKDDDIDAEVSNRLREINLGPWEGKIRSETRISHPEAYNAFWKKQAQFNLEGAETFQSLQKRVVKELDAIFQKGENRNILVVSHWIAIKVALAHYLSISLSQLSDIADPENGSFIHLSKQGSTIRVL